MTALDLAQRPDGRIRKGMGVGGLKTVRELRGEDCIGFDDMPQPKQTTMVSRSFGAVSTAEQNRSKGRRKTGPFSVMRYAVLRVVPLVHRRAPRCFA